MATEPIEQSGVRGVRAVLTPVWLGRHLLALLAFVGLCWLGRWQWDRAMAVHGTLQNLFYAFEWWVFAAVGAYGWWRTVRDEMAGRPGRTSETASAGPAWLPRRTPRDRPADSASVTAVPAAVPVQAAAASATADEPEDAELAAYNAYLARLHARADKS